MSERKLPTDLRVILVDDERERARWVKEALQENGFGVVAVLETGHDLPRQVVAFSPDVIIIDIDSPDRDILENMREVTFEHGRPVVMFTQNGDSETIRASIEAGASAYVVNGLTPERVRPIVEVAIARFARFRELYTELDKVKASLAERKLVEKAKGIFMKRRGCDESEAYRLMRKMAMDQKLRLVDIANKIIEAAELFG